MAKHRPILADVKCSAYKFEPGDRVLVRVFQSLETTQMEKLKRTVQKWAGPDVEVLIYNNTKMEVSVEQRRQRHNRKIPEGS